MLAAQRQRISALEAALSQAEAAVKAREAEARVCGAEGAAHREEAAALKVSLRRVTYHVVVICMEGIPAVGPLHPLWHT
jgi:hypothetical protein